MTEAQLDAALAALAHPTRRALVDRLVQHPGLNTNQLAEGFDVSRIAVMKHLRLLEDARLVVSRKEGRQRTHYFNAVPLQQIVDRWTGAYGAFWAERMVDIKQRIESRLDQTNRKASKSA